MRSAVRDIKWTESYSGASGFACICSRHLPLCIFKTETPARQSCIYVAETTSVLALPARAVTSFFSIGYIRLAHDSTKPLGEKYSIAHQKVEPFARWPRNCRDCAAYQGRSAPALQARVHTSVSALATASLLSIWWVPLLLGCGFICQSRQQWPCLVK